MSFTVRASRQPLFFFSISLNFKFFFHLFLHELFQTIINTPSKLKYKHNNLYFIHPFPINCDLISKFIQTKRILQIKITNI